MIKMAEKLYSRRHLLAGSAAALVGGGLAGHFGPRVYNAAMDLVVPDPIAQLERTVATHAREFARDQCCTDDVSDSMDLPTKRVVVLVKKDRTQYPFLSSLWVTDKSPSGEGNRSKSIGHKFNNNSRGKVHYFQNPSNEYSKTEVTKPFRSLGAFNKAWIGQLYFETLRELLQYHGQFVGSDGIPQLQRKVAENAKKFGGKQKSSFYQFDEETKEGRYIDGILYVEGIPLQQGSLSKNIQVKFWEFRDGRPMLEKILVFGHGLRNPTYFFDHKEDPSMPFLQNPKGRVTIMYDMPINKANVEELAELKELYVATLEETIKFNEKRKPKVKS